METAFFSVQSILDDLHELSLPRIRKVFLILSGLTSAAEGEGTANQVNDHGGIEGIIYGSGSVTVLVAAPQHQVPTIPRAHSSLNPQCILYHSCVPLPLLPEIVSSDEREVFSN